jgi:hypothetical protein
MCSLLFIMNSRSVSACYLQLSQQHHVDPVKSCMRIILCDFPAESRVCGFYITIRYPVFLGVFVFGDSCHFAIKTIPFTLPIYERFTCRATLPVALSISRMTTRGAQQNASNAVIHSSRKMSGSWTTGDSTAPPMARCGRFTTPRSERVGMRTG